MNHRLSAGLLLLALALTSPGRAADSFTWDAKQKQISADAQSWPLPVLLQKIIAATGWQVFVEPGATATASAKFKDLSLGEGLHALLGDLNFALVPQTNAPPQLYVFHTTIQAATQLVTASPAHGGKKLDTSKPIPNQLVITVKPGTDINALAAQLGAKVIGSVDGLNTYLLQFPDEAATAAARAALTSNPSVVSVSNNYFINGLPLPPSAIGSLGPNFQLNARPVGADGKVVVGLVDTAIQPAATANLDGYIKQAISVAGPATPSPDSPTHATMMAENIIAASGNNPPQIIAVDVYGPNETTTTFDVANGIYKAVNAGANPINLSLGSSGNSPLLANVIQQGISQGVTFFAAAGNEPVTTPTYPAAYPGVVAVTAGNLNGSVASYANYGPFVSVVAPGNSLAAFGGQTWFAVGTSSATSWVTGKAAGVAGGSPGASMAQVQTAVVNALPKPKTSP